MKTKIPRLNKSKEQVTQEIKTKEKVVFLREFVKDQFYPALVKASTSIEDAKYLLGSFSNMVMEQFLAKMKEVKFEDLNLYTKLDPTLPQFQEYKLILDLFKDQDVFTTRELIEGMKGEIEMMVTTELKDRKLETLKTNFYESQNTTESN